MSASQFAKVIAESSSTGSEWSLVDGNNVVAHAIISSINPYFQTRREISHIIRLELPREFFKRRWDKILFYGAGCSTPERNKIVELSLVAQFKTPVVVESDLVGAAHGLLQHEAGLACILGPGSNSCFYDGERIVKSVTAGGFILGDEGSGSAMGRIFLSDVLKDLAPRDLIEEFYAKNRVTKSEIMDSVYNNPHANHNLHNYSFFLADHLDPLAYLLAASMDNYGVKSYKLKKRHILDHIIFKILIKHGTAAIFYNNLLSIKFLNIRKSLNKCLCL